MIVSFGVQRTTPGTNPNQACHSAHCSRPFYLIEPLMIWLCVVALDLVTLHYLCVWCQQSEKHTLWTDTDGLSRNSSSRLCLLRGGEGKSGKINKTSLWFILFLFQNKQSYGGGRERERERERESELLSIIHPLWSELFGSRKLQQTRHHSNQKGDTQVRVNRWFIESAARFHILPTSLKLI